MNRHTHNDNLPVLPTNRVVLLGASNLTLSLRLIIQLMQHCFGGPSEVLVAAGHGRSYGQFSQVLFRGLPGITGSGLWQQLELADTLPTYALLTDVGNDIPYEYTPAQILGWVGYCVEQLQKHAAHIVMTNIPIESIDCLPERRYKFLRNILYPSCRLSKSEVVDRARAVHQGLIEMAATKQFMLCELASDWFGVDGIHVSYWKRKGLYQHVLQQLPVSDEIQGGIEDELPFFSTWKQRPEFAHKTLFGREKYCPQPSGRLVDNTAISLY